MLIKNLQLEFYTLRLFRTKVLLIAFLLFGYDQAIC